MMVYIYSFLLVLKFEFDGHVKGQAKSGGNPVGSRTVLDGLSGCSCLPA